MGGYEGAGFSSSEDVIDTVSGDWNGEIYLTLKTDAYDRLIRYYNNLH